MWFDPCLERFGDPEQQVWTNMQNVHPHCNQNHVINALTKYATKISVQKGHKHNQKYDFRQTAYVHNRLSTWAKKLLHKDTHGIRAILHVWVLNHVSSTYGALGMIDK